MPRTRKSKVPNPDNKKEPEKKPVSIDDQIRLFNRKSVHVQGGMTRRGIVQ